MNKWMIWGVFPLFLETPNRLYTVSLMYIPYIQTFVDRQWFAAKNQKWLWDCKKWTIQNKNNNNNHCIQGFWSNYSDLTRPHPKWWLVREISLFQGNLGWWNIIIWPEGLSLESRGVQWWSSGLPFTGFLHSNTSDHDGAEFLWLLIPSQSLTWFTWKWQHWNRRFLLEPSFLGSMLTLGSVIFFKKKSQPFRAYTIYFGFADFPFFLYQMMVSAGILSRPTMDDKLFSEIRWMEQKILPEIDSLCVLGPCLEDAQRTLPWKKYPDGTGPRHPTLLTRNSEIPEVRENLRFFWPKLLGVRFLSGAAELWEIPWELWSWRFLVPNKCPDLKKKYIFHDQKTKAHTDRQLQKDVNMFQ